MSTFSQDSLQLDVGDILEDESGQSRQLGQAAETLNDLVSGRPGVGPVSPPPEPPTLGGDIGTYADLLQTLELTQSGREDLVTAAEVKISQSQGRAVKPLMVFLQSTVLLDWKHIMM